MMRNVEPSDSPLLRDQQKISRCLVARALFSSWCGVRIQVVVSTR